MDNAPNPLALDHALARNRLQRAAGSWDDGAAVHREIGERLLQRLAITRIQPRVVLDAGCGTGLVTRELVRRYKGVRTICLERAPALLRQARKRSPLLRGWACMGAEIDRLPLADRSCDLVFSNLALHWCEDIAVALREFARVLRPAGLLMFASLGPDSLRELRESWKQADTAPHVHGFLDLHDVGDAMLRAGLQDPVTDVERLTVTYPDLGALMADLRALGATNALCHRRRSLTGKDRFRAMRQHYDSMRTDARLPASLEIVYGHAWLSQDGDRPSRRSSSGVATVPLSQVGGRRPRP